MNIPDCHIGGTDLNYDTQRTVRKATFQRSGRRTKPEISPQDAIISAVACTPGLPIDTELKTLGTLRVFDVYVRTGGRTTRVRVDASNGMVLATRTKVAAPKVRDARPPPFNKVSRA